MVISNSKDFGLFECTGRRSICITGISVYEIALDFGLFVAWQHVMRVFLETVRGGISLPNTSGVRCFDDGT